MNKISNISHSKTYIKLIKLINNYCRVESKEWIKFTLNKQEYNYKFRFIFSYHYSYGFDIELIDVFGLHFEEKDFEKIVLDLIRNVFTETYNKS